MTDVCEDVLLNIPTMMVSLYVKQTLSVRLIGPYCSLL